MDLGWGIPLACARLFSFAMTWRTYQSAVLGVTYNPLCRIQHNSAPNSLFKAKLPEYDNDLITGKIPKSQSKTSTTLWRTAATSALVYKDSITL